MWNLLGHVQPTASTLAAEVGQVVVVPVQVLIWSLEVLCVEIPLILHWLTLLGPHAFMDLLYLLGQDLCHVTTRQLVLSHLQWWRFTLTGHVFQ